MNKAAPVDYNSSTAGEWRTNVHTLRKYGSSGRNVAHSTALDSLNRTVVVGEFDSSVQIGTFTLHTLYPSAFIVQTAPSDGVRWAVQCALQPKHKSDGATTAAAYDVAVVDDGSDAVIVGGSFSAASITFTGVNGSSLALDSFASDTSAFLVRISEDGNIDWLRGPVVLDLMYVTAVTASPAGEVFAAGFFQGAVYFNGVPATLPYTEHVQGWLAKFSAQGDLDWVMALLGAGRNVISDVAYAADRAAVAVIGSYQADCAVSTADSTGNTTFAYTLNGTASRSIFVAMVDAPTGAFDWVQPVVDTDPNVPAVTCDDHHYVERAPRSGDVYIVGCFSGSLNFSESPSPDADAVTLSSGSPYNSIYVAKFLANGTLVWTQALLGDNISDYPFSADMVTHPYLDELTTQLTEQSMPLGAAPPAALDEGVLVSAFIQGGWRPLSRPNCIDPQPIVPANAPYGALYAAVLDEAGCVAWITLVAYGRAQPAGLVPQTAAGSFALYGTFTGDVSFGDRPEFSISSTAHSADVFACYFSLEPSGVPPLEDFTRVLWQYSLIGAFGCLFLLALVCIAAMYWPSSNDAARLALLRNNGNADTVDNTAENSGDEGDDDEF